MTSRGGRISPRQWLLASIAVVLLLVLPLWAQMLPGSWNLTASLNQARGGHAAALLPNGQALIVGGTDASGHALASAEIYNASTDAFTLLSGGLTTAASGLTATALNNGTVLVVGGTDDSGNVLATVQIFDPTSTTFAAAPSLSTARSHHTATTLADGTVLIVGGTDGTNVLGSIEIFNPSTRTIAAAASQLANPRKDHTATLLADGRVLIAGGADSNGPLATAELYNPADGSISPAGSLATARTMAAASRLIDDTVIIEGGQDANSAALNSAEIYSPTANTFAAVTAPMVTARASHLGVTLPNNGRVLIAGGSASGQPVGATEVYDPLTGTFIAMTPMNTARSGFGANFFVLPLVGRLLASGGFDSTGTALSSTEMFSFPTIMTDQPDYPPGSQVTITGAGWSANEPVTVDIHESDNDADTILGETADATGAFTDVFQVLTNDGGVTFMMTATGATSNWTAQNKFTDSSNKVGSVSVSGQSPTPSVPAGGNATYTVTVSRGAGSGSSGAFSASLAVTTSLPTGATASFSPTTVTFLSTDPSKTSTLTISTTSTTPTGSTNFTVKATNTGDSGDNASGSGTLVISAPAATQLVFPNSAFTGVVGQCNGPITVQTQNASNTPTDPASSLLVNLSSTSGTGAFFSDSGCAAGITSATIPTSANSASFYYRDGAKGTPTITASSSLTSPTQMETINAASTTTGMGTSKSPTVFGEQVTFTATVNVTAPGTANPTAPTGSVQFYDGGSPLGSAVTLSGGQAQLMTSTLSVATHSITATYTSGDANFSGSTSSILSQVVNKADTTTTITSVNPSPAVVGQGSTVDFTVVAKSPGAGTPTGNVTVSDGTDSCTDTVAHGSCVLTPTIGGALTFTATYAGDSHFNTSSGTQAVNSSANTTTAIGSSASTSVFGQPVTLTATITASGGASNPTCGTVAFSSPSNAVHFATTPATLSGNSAQTGVTFDTIGTYSITATYTPSASSCNYNGSSNSPAFSQTVNQASTNVQVTPASSPITLGQTVAINYTVSAQSPATGTPTGTVTVTDGYNTAGDTCSASVATATCNLTPSVSGLLTVKATYGGDTNFSSNFGQSNLAVNANTTATLTTPTPADFGVPVTFTATITATNASNPMCGTVTFSGPAGVHFANSMVTLSGSNAASTGVTFDGASTYSNITATYSPAASSCYYNPSPTSSPITQVINPATTSTTITSIAPSTGVLGQPVTVHYSVANTSAGSTAAIPGTDTVIVTDDLGDACAATTVAAGSCSLTPSASGSRTVTAKYKGSDDSGDPNFHSSTSIGTTLVVNANTTTALTSTVNPSVFGQATTLTATVSATAGSAPTCGTVTFSGSGAGGGTITFSPSAMVNVNGTSQAAVTATFSKVDSYAIKAAYASGGGTCYYNDSNNNASPLTQTVNPASTSTTITSAPATTFGSSTTVSFTVANTSAGSTASVPATDMVTVIDDLGDNCSATVGTGSCTLTPSAAGTRMLTATYSGVETAGGDPNFHSSTSPNTDLTVYKAPTTLSVTAATGTFGGTTNLSATLTSSAGACTTGKSVSFDVIGNGAGSSSTDMSGSVGLPGVSLSGINAGTYLGTAIPAGVSAGFLGDPNCLPSSGSNTLTVNPANTSTTITNAPATTYGSTSTISFSVSNASVGSTASIPSTDTVTVTDILGDKCSASVGTGSCVLTPSGAGPLTVSARYSGAETTNGDPNFHTSVSPNANLSVSQQPVTVTYTGAEYVSTSSSTATTATVTLGATLQSSTGLGDIRTATLTFYYCTGTGICDVGSATKACSTTVGLVTPGNLLTGTGACQWQNAPVNNTYTILAVAGGNYTGSATDTVTVAYPTTNSINGGGYLLLQTPAGLLPPTASTHNNFGFTVKYNKSGTNLQGNLTTLVRHTGQGCIPNVSGCTFLIKGTSLQSLSVDAAHGKASVQSKAVIQDVTNPLNQAPWSQGNWLLLMNMADNTAIGMPDTIGIVVWDSYGNIQFSSDWNGTQTVQQSLAGGNLSVH